MTLYHGSPTPMEVGDTIRLGAGNVCYATPNRYTARVFGPHVYLVEPVQPGEPWGRTMKHTDDEPHQEVVSTVGFRVVRAAGALPEDPSAECVICLNGDDLDGHDCADHQVVGFHAVDKSPTSEPCPGADECSDCQDMLDQMSLSD